MKHSRWTFFLLGDWTWWAWLAVALLLTLGLAGHTAGFVVALGICLAQTGLMYVRERSVQAFPVQLRMAYSLLLAICLLPGMRWLFWAAAIGTYALVIFGYCTMARLLSLLPWNRREPLSADLLRRTFFSRPTLPAKPPERSTFACAGGLCTIQAQVRPLRKAES